MAFFKKHLKLIFSLVLIAVSFSVTLYNIYHTNRGDDYASTYDYPDWNLAMTTSTPAPTGEPAEPTGGPTEAPEQTAAPVEVDLSDFFRPEGLFIPLNQSYRLAGRDSVDGVVFESSDTAIITIEDAYEIRAIAPGNAVVYAKSSDDGSVINSVDITVYPFHVQLSEDKTYYSITYCAATGPELVIPETVLDLPIRVLARGCLQYHTELESVTVPDTVTEFGYYVFQGCSNLLRIDLPKNLTSIGNCCFYGCGKLTEMTIPDTVSTIGQMAFQDCYSLVSVTVGSGCWQIGSNAFDGCTALRTVNLGGSLSGSKFIDIFMSAYMSPASSLQEVNISSWNASLKSVDGVVYNKAGNVLLFYPFGRTASELRIPYGVVRIDPYAITDNKYLQRIVLPASCYSLEDHSIFACENLVSIDLPGVSTIGVGVLSGCKNLRNVSLSKGLTSVGELSFQKDPGQSKISVTYGGSEAEWNRIRFGADTKWLTEADITYLGGANTPVPTAAPTAEPTAVPTAEPTESPTDYPTEEPTEAPSEEPTEAPPEEPTEAPAETPSPDSTSEPVSSPPAETGN